MKIDSMQVAANCVAKAIQASGKFRKQEHELVIAGMNAETMKAMQSGDMDGAQALMKEATRYGNISALSQDLAKAGLVSHGDPSAFALAVKSELAKLPALA